MGFLGSSPPSCGVLVFYRLTPPKTSAPYTTIACYITITQFINPSFIYHSIAIHPAPSFIYPSIIPSPSIQHPINSYPIGLVNGVPFKSSDVYSNLGGFIIGIFFAMVVIKPTRSVEVARSKSYEAIVTVVGLIGTFVFFAVMFLVFYLGPAR